MADKLPDYDIAIMGLGPAGATLARLLSQNFRVIALDKKRADAGSGFKKPCGGLLSRDAQKALARFDLTLPKDVLVDPQIFAVKTIDLRSRLVRHYQRFYINLDRDKFDRWLTGMIPDRVKILADCRCTSVKRTGRGFLIRYDEAGMEGCLTAKYVVGADGANSLLRRSLYPNSRIRHYISIQQWFKETHSSPFYSCIFDPDTSDCCSWSMSKDNVFIFGGAFPPDDPRGRFEAQKSKLKREFGFRFGEPIRTEACVVLRPSLTDRFCCGGGGAFLIGEAAGFISPSSLEGVSFAINSAHLLADVLNSGHRSPNLAYRSKTLPIRMKLRLKALKLPFMYWPAVRKLIMESGLKAIRVTGSGGQ